MLNQEKRKRNILIVIILLFVIGILFYIIYTFSKINYSYSSIHSSTSIAESKEKGAFRNNVKIVHLEIPDSLKTRLNEVMHEVWIEKMWRYNTSLFKKDIILSKDEYVTFRYSKNYTERSFNFDFNEIFLFEEIEEKIFNFSQNEQYTRINKNDSLFTFIIYINSLNTKIDELKVGKVILKRE